MTVNHNQGLSGLEALFGPPWAAATGLDESSFRLTLLRGVGQIAGDPWLVTLPCTGESPLHDDLVRFGECTLHLFSSDASGDRRAGDLSGGWWEGTKEPGLFVRSPLYSAFPLALECLLRERLTCLDRILFIAEVAFIHRFDSPSS